MEHAHPSINAANLLNPNMERLAKYALHSKTDLAACFYLDGYPPVELAEIELGYPGDIDTDSLELKQDWLDQTWENKIAYAERIYLSSNDNLSAWREFQRTSSLWYQKGVLELGIFTTHDIDEFRQLYESNEDVRRQYQSRGDSMRSAPIAEEDDENLRWRAHP
jgi:hypothetical protein